MMIVDGTAKLLTVLQGGAFFLVPPFPFPLHFLFCQIILSPPKPPCRTPEIQLGSHGSAVRSQQVGTQPGQQTLSGTY